MMKRLRIYPTLLFGGKLKTMEKYVVRELI